MVFEAKSTRSKSQLLHLLGQELVSRGYNLFSAMNILEAPRDSPLPPAASLPEGFFLNLGKQSSPAGDRVKVPGN